MGELSLITRLSEGENEHQDFKFCITDSRKLAETISAFSNASGGSVFIGVKDNGKIRGIDPEEEGFMADAAASMYCNPPVNCGLKVWETSEGKVLELLVPPVQNRPVMADTSDHGWRAFIRVGDINHLAPWILTECWKLQQSSESLSYKHTPREGRIFSALREGVLLSQKQLEKITRIPRPILIKLMGKLLCWEVVQLQWGVEGPLYRLNPESPVSPENLNQSKVPFRNNKAIEK